MFISLADLLIEIKASFLAVVSDVLAACPTDFREGSEPRFQSIKVPDKNFRKLRQLVDVMLKVLRVLLAPFANNLIHTSMTAW